MNQHPTPAELIERVRTRLKAAGFEHRDSETRPILTAVLNALTEQILAAGEAPLYGFGRFWMSYQKPKRGRDPRSGDPIQLPAMHLLRFTPGDSLRGKVRAVDWEAVMKGGKNEQI